MRGTSYCSWFGITCGSGGTAIVGLSLVDAGVGAWPASVSGLQYLQSFYYEAASASGNASAVGSLPAGMASWTALTSLSISCRKMPTCFTGALDVVSSSSSLKSLSLQGMSAIGAPASWSLTSLTSLRLRNTPALGGVLPSPPQLTTLDVESANFSSVSALPSGLRSIAISDTPLAGTFPSLGALLNLSSIVVSGTLLSGALPDDVCGVLNPHT